MKAKVRINLLQNFQFARPFSAANQISFELHLL